MERLEIEVFSRLSNHAIVRMPGRQFPGTVIQGDSLAILYHLASEIHEQAQSTTNEELVDLAEELMAVLEARLRHYETVLGEHGMKLPYSSIFPQS